MDKESYEKGLKIGYVKGVQAAKEVMMACERDPEDQTKLSLKVTTEIDALCD